MESAFSCLTAMNLPSSLLIGDQNADVASRRKSLPDERTTGAEIALGEEAIHEGRRAADEPNGEEEFITGMNFEYGIGVERDDQEAIGWYQEAAKKGNVSAQFTLALKYEYGTGVEQHEQEAAHWYREAAKGGNVAAQFIIAVKYEYGFGVKRDPIQARHWYRKSSEQGDAEAQSKLDAITAIPSKSSHARSPLMFLKNLGAVCRTFIS
jgi:TPR repeat protein